jgi:hypothetical protein
MIRRSQTPSPDDLDRAINELEHEDAARLIARWRSLMGRTPGPGLRGELLRAALAHKIQERAFGGPQPPKLRKLARLAKAHEQTLAGKGRSDDASAPPVRTIKPGSRLIREWRGVVHEVIVEADGYRWDGRDYSSLSTIAKTITGTSWNGWRFFGLTQPSERQARPVKRTLSAEEACHAAS